MPAREDAGPAPPGAVTSAPAGDPGEIRNWDELLYFFNHTLPECHVELREDAKQVTLFVLYLAIFVVGLLENVVVIGVSWRRAGRGLLSLYALHMAVADLGIVLSLPVWMLEVALDYTWLWGGFSCRFTHYFYFANMYSSIFFLLCLSVDRYVSLAAPGPQPQQQRLRRAVCAGVWLLSAVLPLPEVAHMQLLDGAEPVCLFMAPFEAYSAWALAVALSTSVLGFLLPFPLMVLFNVLTACRLRRAGRPEGRRHCLLVCAYLGAFAACWLPYHATLLLLTLHGTHVSLHCYLVHLLYFFYDIIDCFAMLHCVLNPLLYNFLSPRFREQLLSAVVHYLPKARARADRRASSSSSSSTQHSIVITKEGTQPTAAGTQAHPGGPTSPPRPP